MPYLITEHDHAWQHHDLVAGIKTVEVLRSGGLRIGSGMTPRRGDDALARFLVLPYRVDNAGRFALITRSQIQINGMAVNGGLQTLSDRDEIRVMDERMYYSAQSLPRVTTCDQTAAQPVLCNICGDGVIRGQDIVPCPDCSIIFHERCWRLLECCSTYGCQASTTLDDVELWTPASKRNQDNLFAKQT